jgi:hypothetical protein
VIVLPDLGCILRKFIDVFLSLHSESGDIVNMLVLLFLFFLSDTSGVSILRLLIVLPFDYSDDVLNGDL